MVVVLALLAAALLAGVARGQAGRAIDTDDDDQFLDGPRYRSNCRCERINRCPRLQVLVAPRCREGYFLCCFPRNYDN